jgi:hypothetical protein
MSLPPIPIEDLSLLFGVSAILLLVTAEFIPYVFGEKTLVSEMKKLRNMAIGVGIMFLATVAIIILNIAYL